MNHTEILPLFVFSTKNISNRTKKLHTADDSRQKYNPCYMHRYRRRSRRLVPAPTGSGHGLIDEPGPALQVYHLRGIDVGQADGLRLVGRIGREYRHCVLEALVACWHAAGGQADSQREMIDIGVCGAARVRDGVGDAVVRALIVLRRWLGFQTRSPVENVVGEEPVVRLTHDWVFAAVVIRAG